MSFAENIGSHLHALLEEANKSLEDKLKERTELYLQTVDEKWQLMNEEVRGLFGAERTIDEMAVYFPDRELLVTFMAQAAQRGWQLFNFAEDNVVTRPIIGTYAVEYWFMESPNLPYRLELMTIPDGFSPYHASLFEACRLHHAPASIVHASFKVPDEESYGAAVVGLRKAEYELAQHCESTYGRFSYFVRYDADNARPALKPRLNMRDASEADKMNHDPHDDRSWLSGGPFPGGADSGN
jgi:hypothetical protein